MRRLHTDERRSRTATARLPAVLAPRPYLEAKAFTTHAASRIRNNFADHRYPRKRTALGLSLPQPGHRIANPSHRNRFHGFNRPREIPGIHIVWADAGANLGPQESPT